jgi:hypothetical protein
MQGELTGFERMTDKAQLEVDFGINNGFSPGDEGPRAFGYNVAFPGNTAEVLVDLTLAEDLGFIGNAQGIFIDNTGTAALSLRIPGVEQTIRIPGECQMIGPIALPRTVRQLYFTSNEAKTIRFHLFNVPLPYAVYSTSVGGGGSVVTIAGQPISVSGPLTDTQLRATAVPVSGPLTDAELRATAVPVSGPLTDTQLRATAVPVSGPLTDTELRATAVPVTGPLTDAQLRATAVPVTASKPSTGTRSSVAGAAADTLVLASNAARLGATVYNDSTAILYLGLGTTAVSTTDYSAQLVAGAYYEVPFDFTGQIRGYWASATGNARVTELT